MQIKDNKDFIITSIQMCQRMLEIKLGDARYTYIAVHYTHTC